MKNLLKFIGIRSLLIMALLHSYKYQAQSPNTDALFDTVFVDNFNTVNTSNWSGLYPWGMFYNTNVSTNPLSIQTVPLCPGSPNFPSSVAGVNANLLDTNNFKVATSGSMKYIRLTARKETPQKPMKVWKKFYNCGDPLCNNPCWGSACLHDSTMNFKYSNAMLASAHCYKYGYIEIKFRIPEYSNPTYITNLYHSSAATFWLLGGTTVSPYNELDIYEISANEAKYTNNWHLKVPSSTQLTNNPYGYSNVHNIDLGQWHTAGVNWTPKYLDYYLDDAFVRRDNQDSVALLDTMYIYIENAIPNGLGCYGIDTINTPFPLHYDLDYVRVWQPKLDCSNDKIYTNVTQSSYVSKVYKSLLIGGIGYSSTFTSGFTHFVANNGIELKEGFEVSGNGTGLLEILPCFSGMTNIYKPSDLGPAPQNARSIH